MNRPALETLFLACTRPAMFAGVPIEASGILVFVFGELIVATHRPIPIAMSAAIAYVACRIATAYDYNIFRLLFLWVNTKLRGLRNAAYWGGSSASPAPLKAPRRVSEISQCIS